MIPHTDMFPSAAAVRLRASSDASLYIYLHLPPLRPLIPSSVFSAHKQSLSSAEDKDAAGGKVG